MTTSMNSDSTYMCLGIGQVDRYSNGTLNLLEEARRMGCGSPSYVENWIASTRSDLFDDPELVGPFTDHFSMSKTRRERLDTCQFSEDKVDSQLAAVTPPAIRGNFIPVSASVGSHLMPKSGRTDLGVHIHLSLTDSQMDKLTTTFSGQNSPAKKSRRDQERRVANTDPTKKEDSSKEVITVKMSQPQKSHSRRDHGAGARRNEQPAPERGGRDTTFGDFAHRSRSRSPMKRSRSPAKDIPKIPHSSTGPSALPDRRQVVTPAPINVDSVRQYGSLSGSRHAELGAPNRAASPRQLPVTPTRLHGEPRFSFADSSSIYSQNGGEDDGVSQFGTVSPLQTHAEYDPNRSNSVLRSYDPWTKSPTSPTRGTNTSTADPSPTTGRLQRKQTTGDLRLDSGQPERTYSPLSDYLSSKDLPVRKELIGAHGWLERTTGSSKKGSSPDKKSTPQRKGRLLDSLKKMAKDMADLTSSRRTRGSDKDHRVSRLIISLDPREQSLLFCEMEFILTTALDCYITTQFNAGRLEADKYKRIVDGWQQKGRPKVVGFRYDLETQLDLVSLHCQEFRFYGRRAGMIVAVTGLLDMMKVNARAMRIRTFCQPDTVIAKQLLDSQSLFNMLGCSEQQQIQLAEIIQFFKTVLEREEYFKRVSDNSEKVEAAPSEQRGNGWKSGHATPERPDRRAAATFTAGTFDSPDSKMEEPHAL